jgi:septal ring factor EnvC (AmiA/AmiB activator)
MRQATFALAVLVILGGAAHADIDPLETAARAAEMLDEAAIALSEAEGARDRVEALTGTIRAFEEGLLALREGTRRAATRERTILLVFEAERDRLARLLAVLQTIEAAPAPLLMIHPAGPLGTARSGMIVSDVTPAIAAEAMALRDQLREIAIMRALQDNAVSQLSAALDGVQTARSTLSQAIADRRVLPARFSENDAAMMTLLESATSLDGFAETLRQAGTIDLTDPSLARFSTARGALPLPVLGVTLRGFNEADAAGVTRPGLVLATRPGALITAPWAASVRYAGPLLDYGNVIILEPDGDYLLILAGVDEMFVDAGEIVSTDAPLALMGGLGTENDELIVPATQGGGVARTESLYIELREAGVPVDPTEWFTID